VVSYNDAIGEAPATLNLSGNLRDDIKKIHNGESKRTIKLPLFVILLRNLQPGLLKLLHKYQMVGSASWCVGSTQCGGRRAVLVLG
jgi:hypothetical protein